jgi:hypothetical protein
VIFFLEKEIYYQGECPMKRVPTRKIIAAVCLLTGTAWLGLTSCQQEQPMPVQGSFIFEITDSSAQSSGSGNITSSGSDSAVWEGSFQGTSTGMFEEIRNETGYGSYRERVTFEGSVEGREGTLKMHLEGERQDRDSAWEGTWEILEGEGGLANLQGSGTWIEPEDYHVDYTGEIQFAPKLQWQFWKSGK